MNPQDTMTLQDVETRLQDIATEIETRGEAISPEQLTQFSTEVEGLTQRKNTLIQANEQRSNLLTNLANNGGTHLRSFPTTADSPNDELEDVYATPQYRRAFMNNVLKDTPMPQEFRNNNVTKTTDVGSVIPTTILNRIVEKMEAVGMILPLVTRTSVAGGVGVPTSTVKPIATWVNQGEGSAKQKLPTGTITFTYHKLRCAVAVTLEVATMALDMFENMLVNTIVQAMTKALEQSIIDGTGIGQPQGILTEAVDGDKIIAVATIDYQTLIKAEAAVPIEHEANTRYCMTKKTWMAYQGMTDDNGQPIARTNMGLRGAPERTLLGRPVVLCNYLPSFDPSLADGTVFAFLFNFSDYILNSNYTMGVKRYEDNETDDQVTRAIMLADGKVVDNSSLVILKKAKK